MCTFVGKKDADVVVCQAMLERVLDTARIIRSLATTVKPGGAILIFAPSRNAVFSRIDLVLPQAVKRRLLFALFPETAEGLDVFKAYYNCCTPREIEMIARANDLEVLERRLFWMSTYFSQSSQLAWRRWQLLAYMVQRDNAAEIFALILRKGGELAGGADSEPH
jgi:SAM-dependent methyltransferase